MRTTPHDQAGKILQAAFTLGRLLRTKMASGKPDDLHMGQLHAMIFIAHQPGITMTDLAKILCVTSPTATSFVDRLVRMGFVTRGNDAKNRKLVRLKISPVGKRILTTKMREKKKVASLVLSSLSAKDQAQLLTILTKMIEGCSTI